MELTEETKALRHKIMVETSDRILTTLARMKHMEACNGPEGNAALFTGTVDGIIDGLLKVIILFVPEVFGEQVMKDIYKDMKRNLPAAYEHRRRVDDDIAAGKPAPKTLTEVLAEEEAEKHMPAEVRAALEEDLGGPVALQETTPEEMPEEVREVFERIQEIFEELAPDADVRLLQATKRRKVTVQ